MSSWMQRAAMITAVLIGLTLGMMPLDAVAADDPVKIRVNVTDDGFNGKADDFVVDVEQGKLVELTFVWAHEMVPRESHIFVLEGYNLETEKLNSERREVTLKFIADKPGSFNFKCTLKCETHDYFQRGYLKVQRSGQGGAAALTPTRLTVSPSSWATGGETVTLTAVLRDTKGAPVPKAEIRFLLDAEFAGAKGKMDIGRARTDAEGIAVLDFKPTLVADKLPITARFAGMGVYAESQQAFELQEDGVPPSAYVMEPTGLTGAPSWAAPLALHVADQPLVQQFLSHWATSALVLVVLAVWFTFAFILYQAFSISRVRPRR